TSLLVSGLEQRLHFFRDIGPLALDLGMLGEENAQMAQRAIIAPRSLGRREVLVGRLRQAAQPLERDAEILVRVEALRVRCDRLAADRLRFRVTAESIEAVSEVVEGEVALLAFQKVRGHGRIAATRGLELAGLFSNDSSREIAARAFRLVLRSVHRLV